MGGSSLQSTRHATAVLVRRNAGGRDARLEDGNNSQTTVKVSIEACWPPNTDPGALLTAIAQLALTSGKPITREIQPAHSEPEAVVVASPIQFSSDGQAESAFAMIQPRRRKVVENKDDVDVTAEPTDATTTPESSNDPLSEENRARSALRLIAQINQYERFNGACVALVNELSRLTGASRVGLGFIRDGSLSVHTISGSAQVSNKTALLRDLAMAMNEGIDQACTVVYPSESTQTAKVTLNHGRFTIRHSSPTICTVPMAVRDESGRAIIGSISLEFGNARSLDTRAITFAERISSLVASSLDTRRRLDLPVTGRIARMFSSGSRRSLEQSSKKGKILLSVTTALLLAAALIPLPFRVAGDARLEGAMQRVLAAPVEGFIGKVHTRPGQQVKVGDPMVDLDDRDLSLQQSRWESELGQIQKRYGEAMATESQTDIAIERARLGQARAQLETIKDQLSRMRLIAPFDGIVLSGDLSQALGSPVQRGQTLMTIAPIDQFRVIVNVDERDIALVNEGSTGQLLLPAAQGDPIEIEVTRISPIALVNNQLNVFEVQARLLTSPSGVRPGLEGVAKIAGGNRSLLSGMTSRLRSWLRMTLWRWGL